MSPSSYSKAECSRMEVGPGQPKSTPKLLLSIRAADPINTNRPAMVLVN